MSTDKPPVNYITIRKDSNGVRLESPSPFVQRHYFYHVIANQGQRNNIETTFRKLGVNFVCEQNPTNFEASKKRIELLQRQLYREQSDHGQTRRLRQLEKDTLQSFYDTCLHKIEKLQDEAQVECPGHPEDYLKRHAAYIKSMEAIIKAVEGVQNQVKEVQEEYMKHKRISDDLRKKITSEPKRYIAIQPKNHPPLVVKRETPKEEGAINVLDLMGEDDEAEASSMNIFNDVKKEEAMEDGEGFYEDDNKVKHVEKESEEGSDAIDNTAQKTFRAVLIKRLRGKSEEHNDIQQLERADLDIESSGVMGIDEDMKPPKLEAEGDLSQSNQLAPKTPIFRRVVHIKRSGQEPMAKRPRILGNGVSYRIYSPSNSTMSRPRYPSATRILDSEELTKVVQALNHNSVNMVNGIPVQLRPTSSTNLSNEEKNRLIAETLQRQKELKKPPVERVNSVIFRRDYKNPPAPLPADDGTHVLCHLCDNRIMCTRLSNLTNHVRRHSAIKQYQCAHCNYQHNEQAKVRLHMQNNHNDCTSLCQDNLTKEMQQVWSTLMEQCFPGYMDQLKKTQPNSSVVDWDRAGMVRSRGDTAPTTLDELHGCVECGDAITVNSTLKNMTVTEPLADHITENHLNMCVAYTCGECGYVNAEEWKVRWHISNRHNNKPDIEVVQEPGGAHMDIFLYKFFPTIEKVIGPKDDPDEEELKNVMGGDTQATSLSSLDASGVTGLIKEEIESEQEETSSQSTNDKFNYNDARVDPQPNGDQILCHLCNKILEWTNKNTLCSLLAHAKRHFKIKQFQCRVCQYASSESAHVKNHMVQRHNSQEKPKEHNNEFMQTSWLGVMRRCFPTLRERIDSFKFKTTRTYNPKEETANRTPPKHSYLTRRKRNFVE